MEAPVGVPHGGSLAGQLKKSSGSHNATHGTYVVTIRVGSHAKTIMMSTGFIMPLTDAPVTLAPR